MKSELNMRQARTWDITVESDWCTALGAVALFIVAALLLVREIERFIGGHFSRSLRLHLGFRSIWNMVSDAIAALYCFIFAFKFRNKYVNTAFVLMGVNLTGFVLLSCFQIPTRALHIASVSGSAVRQIALAIFCVALAQWLRSVVRWDRPSELPGGKI